MGVTLIMYLLHVCGDLGWMRSGEIFFLSIYSFMEFVNKKTFMNLSIHIFYALSGAERT